MREKVINEIKQFMEKWHISDIDTVTFEEVDDTNCVIVRGAETLYKIINEWSYSSYLGDLPRDIIDIVLEKHPEIMEEFYDEYEELDYNPEKYEFPNKIEFDSEEEYEQLKEQFLYEEKENFLKSYWNPLEKFQVGEEAFERLERCISKHGFGIMSERTEETAEFDCENMVVFSSNTY